MTVPTPTPFDLVGPLPEGTLAIEASAGTGKTFALAALATRFIAEHGVAASQLLVVTFTRAATTELRARVRQQLVDAAAHLLHDDPPATENELLRHLSSVGPDERRERLARVELAIGDFDTATITTIHGFATQALGMLGVAAGTDPDATLLDDAGELAAEVCADVLAAAAVAGHPGPDLPTYTALLEATQIRLNSPDLVVVPSPNETGAENKHCLLAQLVGRSVEAMDERRRRAGTLSFNDILLELRRALDGPGRATVIDALRGRFSVALIDEFQDTDPVQWTIFSTIFGEPGAHTRLVLVGDPKQAIYAFRGANIHTYSEAVTPGPGLANRSLGTNWRADGALLIALNTLLDGATFGDDGISYLPVQPAVTNRDKRLADNRGNHFPPLSLRLALGDDLERGKKKPHDVITGDAERAVYTDLVDRIRDLLDHAELPADGGGTPRRVRPSDIAVLVRSHAESAAVQMALTAQGVPAVLSRGGSVLESPAAEQWRWLLEALMRPSDPGRARTFALSWFGGRSAAQVDQLDDDALADIHERLGEWAETLSTHGVNDLIRRVWSDSGVSGRVLGRPDGDRAMTDLAHLAELLQTTASGDHPSVARLLSMLDLEPDADSDADGNVATRRIESDRQAVKIMTIWVAKGLEFPVVCCPTLWRAKDSRTIYQDPVTGERTFDVAGGKDWPDKAGAAARKILAARESAGENLRLMYVALTRAKHHTLVWWTRCQRSDTTGLARVLFARTDGIIDSESFGSAKVQLPPDTDALNALAPVIQVAEGNIVATVHGRLRERTDPWVDTEETSGRPDLAVARLDRVPDRSRQRWSFTAITRHAASTHFDPYDLTLADSGAADEQGGDELAEPASTGSADASPFHPVPLHPMALLPAGADFGTLVHSVLEEIDFTAEDLDRAITAGVDREQQWRSLDLRPVGVDGATDEMGRQLLVAGLRAAVETPLGPLFGDCSLRGLARVDRLDEMSFELLLGEAGRHATDRDIGRLVLRHLDDADPLLGWAAGLADGAFSVDLAGHLTGSIDAVLRVRDAHGRSRFVIVDYKTNRLNSWGRIPDVDDYRRDALANAMAEHHYPLQALLYSVALHRYLRWRLKGYDPAVHLGGAAYLFVRGMTGADVATADGHPDGVFSWAIPPRLVTELSDLLDGQRIPEVSR